MGSKHLQRANTTTGSIHLTLHILDTGKFITIVYWLRQGEHLKEINDIQRSNWTNINVNNQSHAEVWVTRCCMEQYSHELQVFTQTQLKSQLLREPGMRLSFQSEVKWPQPYKGDWRDSETRQTWPTLSSYVLTWTLWLPFTWRGISVSFQEWDEQKHMLPQLLTVYFPEQSRRMFEEFDHQCFKYFKYKCLLGRERTS